MRLKSTVGSALELCQLPTVNCQPEMLNEPVVSVPVLSNTTCVMLLNISRLFAFLNSTPFLAARPKPTAMAAGVASPMAQGHAITNTAILLNRLVLND